MWRPYTKEEIGRFWPESRGTIVKAFGDDIFGDECAFTLFDDGTVISPECSYEYPVTVFEELARYFLEKP